MNNVILRLLISSVLLMNLSFCDGNYVNISFNGKITNSLNQPLKNVEVKVTCWVYSTEKWESESIEKTVITNETGEFEVFFKKGEALDFEINYEGYQLFNKSYTIKTNKMDEVFVLIPRK